MISKSFVSRACLLAFFLVTMISGVGATERTPSENSERILESVCPLADPICFALSQISPPPSPVRANRLLLTDSFINARSRARNMGVTLRASSALGAPLAADAVTVRRSATSRYGYVATPGSRIRIQGMNAQIDFDGSDVSGQLLGPNDANVRSAHLPVDPNSCFERFLTPARRSILTFQGRGESVSLEAERRIMDLAWLQTLHCLYPCMTDEDTHRLLSCMERTPDSDCMQPITITAQAEHRFTEGFLPDPLTRTCPVPQTLSSRVQEEVERTHTCPRDLTDVAAIREYVDRKMREGYDSTNVPRPGAILACGYNSSFQEFWLVQGRMQNSLEFIDQGASHLPLNCVQYFRTSPSDRNFMVRGRACNGSAGYRNGGRVGDTFLIPLSRDVWIQTFVDRNGNTYYYGLLIRRDDLLTY